MKPTQGLYMRARLSEDDPNRIEIGTFTASTDECVAVTSLARDEALDLFDDLEEALLGH